MGSSIGVAIKISQVERAMILKTQNWLRVPVEHNGTITPLRSETAAIYPPCTPPWEHIPLIVPPINVPTLRLYGIPTRKTNLKNTN